MSVGPTALKFASKIRFNILEPIWRFITATSWKENFSPSLVWPSDVWTFTFSLFIPYLLTRCCSGTLPCDSANNRLRFTKRILWDWVVEHLKQIMCNTRWLKSLCGLCENMFSKIHFEQTSRSSAVSGIPLGVGSCHSPFTLAETTPWVDASVSLFCAERPRFLCEFENKRAQMKQIFLLNWSKTCLKRTTSGSSPVKKVAMPGGPECPRYFAAHKQDF